MNYFNENGFEIIPRIYGSLEIEAIINAIESSEMCGPSFRKNGGLFAIRQFFKSIASVRDLVITPTLLQLVKERVGDGFVVVKSIYFDKPAESNWFVASHQDLTISVKQKHEIPGFGPWTVKGDQFAVQPPTEILEDNITIRIHLDDTDENNGALLVVPKTHLDGVIDLKKYSGSDSEEICRVPKGGVMLMKPLLMHRSKRSLDAKRRRVIHLELSRKQLPSPLEWAER